MIEPRRDVDAAFERVDAGWDVQRTERTLVGLKRKRSTARRVRAATFVGAVAAIATLSVATWPGLLPNRATQVSTEASGAASEDVPYMTLADGSRVFRRDAQSRVSVREESNTRAVLELEVGAARFDVRHREERLFRVHSGQVSVQVLGTEFELERVGERTRVAVLRGRVAVAWPGGGSQLGAGEAGWFPREAPQPEAAGREDALDEVDPKGRLRAAGARPQLRAAGSESQLEAADLPSELDAAEPRLQLRAAGSPSRLDADPTSQRRARGASRSGLRGARLATRKLRTTQAAAWHEPAEQGDFDRAYELLRQAPQPSPDDVEELLLAADTARLSGHPSAALTFLKQVIDGHSQDSRAPLAAFTLGGLLMQQLGLPREAEAAYARARALSLNSSLAEDALARQVEAAHRAGDASRARVLAEEYLARYPDGRRVHAVQRFGGMIR